MSETLGTIAGNIQLRKLALTNNTLKVLLVVCFVFMIKAIMIGALVRIYGITFSFIVCVVAMWMIVLERQTLALNLTFLVIWVCIAIASITTGGTESVILCWLPVTICLAGLLGGERFCLTWAFICSATLGAFWSSHLFFPTLQDWVVQEDKTMHLRMHIVAQMFMMATIVLSFIRLSNRYEGQILEQAQGLATEVEQRREAQRLARVYGEAKTQFFVNMSHEMRTPLNSVIGYSKRILRSDRITDEKDLQSLQCIHRNGKNLLLLVNDLLDFAALEAHHLNYFATPFSCWQLVEECVAMAEPIADQYNLSIECNCHRDVEIQGDRGRLAQVLQGVLLFSLRQTTAGGLAVQVRPMQRRGLDGVEIHILDTCDTIKQEQLDHLFDGHHQLVFDTTREIPISPLSMVFGAKLVEMHGGHIQASSIDGEGILFDLWLPTAPICVVATDDL